MQVIVYHSQHGFTKEVASIIAESFDYCLLMDVDQLDYQILNVASQIIIGTPVYEGKLDEIIVQFILDNQPLLIEKQYSMFIVGVWQTEFMTPVTHTFNFEILKDMKVIMGVGGKLDYTSLSLKEKMILEVLNKRSPVIHREKDQHVFCNLNREELNNFIKKVKALGVK